MTGSHGGDAEDPLHPDLREQLRARREELREEISIAKEHFEEANEKIKERTGRDLIVAILIGLALGAVLIGTLAFEKWLYVPAAIAIILLGTYELGRALRQAGRRIDVIPQLLGALLLAVSAAFADWSLTLVVLFAVIFVIIVWRLVGQMIAADGRTYGNVLADVLISAFMPAYVPFLASLTIVLTRQDGGQWWVLGFIIVVVAADTSAYGVGILLGKHPMAPRISPNKTWEGFAGAVVGSCVAATLVAVYMLQLPWWAGPIIGLTILGTATLGDLAESMLKRDLGIKDMSSWLPGHGGILDRIDSILPSAAAAICLYVALSPLAGAA